jgi:hypothetical protein
VPTSRTPNGAYEFVPPWTLDRFRADLAEVPGAIVQAWIMLDRRGAKVWTHDDPATTSHTHKPASTTAQATDLSLTSKTSKTVASATKPKDHSHTPQYHYYNYWAKC